MHGTSMSMKENGVVKVDKRKENAFIFTKRFVNNFFGKDMKKQSALSLVTGHYCYKDVQVHPWTINFALTDVNFDAKMHKKNPFDFVNIFDNYAQRAREIELDIMFNHISK